MSLPVGIAVVLSFTSSFGMSLLAIIRPIFYTLLSVIEPLFLLIEIFIVMRIIHNLNSWISGKANSRDEGAHDLSSWEPPLARSSILARLFIILLTIASYACAYLVVYQSKTLLSSVDLKDQPLNFNHAIATLVTLQIIAVTITIYKDEGIISEMALVCLASSIPILIASWSYNQLTNNTTTLTSLSLR